MLGELITLVTLLCVFIITVLLLHWYSSPKTHCSVYLLVFIGWFSSFIIITLIPYDIYLSKSHSSSVSLKPVWFLLYWAIFVVCWLILPVMNSYYRSGEFSRGLRLKDALKTEAKFVSIVAAAFAGFVVYLMIIGQMALINIPEIFVLLSNLWGLFLVMILLGFGLVIIPVNLWKKGNLKRSLEVIQIRLVNLEYKKKEISEGIAKIRNQVHRLKNLQGLDLVLKNCAECIWIELKDHLDGLENDEGLQEINPEGEKLQVNYKELVRIHKKVKNLLFEKKRNDR